MTPEASRADTAVRAPAVTETTVCRLCGHRARRPLWSFGTTPLANAYRRAEDRLKAEVTAPLEVEQCAACALVQLRHTVHPDLLWPEYLYVSSTSPNFVAHFAAYADDLVRRFSLRPGSLAIDIGSNDGILLKPLKAHGLRVLGIEPARRIAAAAAEEGIETLPAYFTEDYAESLRATYGPAAIISMNNTFAHVPDVSGIARGIRTLLSPDGVFVVEVQYLGDLLKKNLFDVVYHEHLCYYHLGPLVSFFERQGLKIFDVERVPTHGGSLRVFVAHADASRTRTARTGALLAEETAAGLATPEPYAALTARVARNRERLRQLLADLRRSDKRVVGYGAPAKATTLCSVFGLTGDDLAYIVDDDKLYKQGRYMPGTHIPIVSPDRLYADRPDACLILAWNFAEAILENHRAFTERGGRFIVPVPEPRVVGNDPIR